MVLSRGYVFVSFDGLGVDTHPSRWREPFWWLKRWDCLHFFWLSALPWICFEGFAQNTAQMPARPAPEAPGASCCFMAQTALKSLASNPPEETMGLRTMSILCRSRSKKRIPHAATHLLLLPPGYRFSIFTQILPTPKISITQGVSMLRSPLEYMLAGLRYAHTNNCSWFFGTLWNW